MTLQRAARPPSLLRRIIRLGLISGLVLLGILILVICSISLWMSHAESARIYTRVEDVPAQAVALVLGAGPSSKQFDYRLDAAVKLYQAGKVKHFLVSGEGVAVDPQGSETALMRQGLMMRGIPSSAITRDDAGFRTLDSVVRARRIFGLKSVIIVSQDYHLPRALYLAQAWNLDAVGFAATNVDYDLYDTYLREWLARVKAVADILILNTDPRTLGPRTPLNLDSPPASSSH